MRREVKVDKTPQPDLADLLDDALRSVRLGDYDHADSILLPLHRYLPSSEDDIELSPNPKREDFLLLRLATLVADVAEYKGDYKEAKKALEPYRKIVLDLREMHRKGESLDFTEFDSLRQKFERQKLYYLWQRSIWCYRMGPSDENEDEKKDDGRGGTSPSDEIKEDSRDLLDLAIALANRFEPRSEPLLTQLFYGDGKLAFRECKEGEAIAAYQRSLMSASRRLREKDVSQSEIDAGPIEDKRKAALSLDVERKAAQYSLAKTLALGLGQCLREQGRLREAHTQVVAGRLLLNLGVENQLSEYARLLLGSIERSMAGEEEGSADLLDHAAKQISRCAEHFKDHKGEVGYRSRLELALVRMQQKRLDEAKKLLKALLKPEPLAKWVAEGNLGLSRIARREKAHKQSVDFARKAVKAASVPGLERIKRRAQVVLVLALYDAATDGGIHFSLLKETQREIERALIPVADVDVRTRANMLLTRARVLKAKGEGAAARRVYREFKVISPLIEVGRIHELAKKVEEELVLDLKEFQCPADLVPPVYDLDKNFEALDEYVKKKVKDDPDLPTVTEQTRALGRARDYLSKKPVRARR